MLSFLSVVLEIMARSFSGVISDGTSDGSSFLLFTHFVIILVPPTDCWPYGCSQRPSRLITQSTAMEGSAKTMWARPPGPPRVWRTVDVVDSTGDTRKFSLQEIPEERYDEAVQHMCRIYLRDEIMASSLNCIDDAASIDLCTTLWKLVLAQGIAVGAFEVLDGEEPALAGLNMLIYADAEVDAILGSMEWNSSRAEKFILFALETSGSVDPRKLHGVDCYLNSFGLSVDPKYRRLGLGRRLLELRSDVGRTYGVEYTSTLFTSPVSQTMAESAGFHTDLERCYGDAVDAGGNLVFPSLKTMSCKVMGKRLF